MLLLLLPLLASGAPSSGPCCTSKTVGGLEYTLVREDSAALSLSCLSPCVYERSGMPGLDGGPQYCFARGEQTVFCGNSTSNVAGILEDSKVETHIGVKVESCPIVTSSKGRGEGSCCSATAPCSACNYCPGAVSGQWAEWKLKNWYPCCCRHPVIYNQPNLSEVCCEKWGYPYC